MLPSYERVPENKGYVYIAVNEYIPNVIKVGRTNDPKQRATDLSYPRQDGKIVNAVPGEYRFEKKWWVFNAFIVEEQVLQMLKVCADRVNAELFYVDSFERSRHYVKKIVLACKRNHGVLKLPVITQLSLFKVSGHHAQRPKEYYRVNCSSIRREYPPGAFVRSKKPLSKKVFSRQSGRLFKASVRIENKCSYIYVLANKYIPYLVRFGITKGLNQLVDQLSNQTGVPWRYEVTFQCSVNDQYVPGDETLQKLFGELLEPHYGQIAKGFFIVPSLKCASHNARIIIETCKKGCTPRLKPRSNLWFGEPVDEAEGVSWDKRYKPRSKSSHRRTWRKSWWIEEKK